MNISKKLFLSLIGLTSIILLVTLLLARWSFDQGFTDFINALEQQRLGRISTEVQAAYQQSDNTWDKAALESVDRTLYLHSNSLPNISNRQAGRIGPSTRPEFPPPKAFMERRGPPQRRGPPADILTAMFSLNDKQLAGPKIEPSLFENAMMSEYVVQYQGQDLVVLKSWNKDKFGSSMGSEFSRQQLLTSLWIGLACLLLASVLSFYWSKALLNPIKSVIEGIKRLSLGQYNVEIEHSRKDEFGALINDVNALAAILEQTKSAKSRWFADISHELRTPLSVLLGEIEAMQMGIRPLNQDNLQSLQQEALLLKRLIEDLYQLSLSDLGALRYEFVQFDVSLLAHRQCESMLQSAAAAGIDFTWEISDELMLLGDENRIAQLLNNLLRNSMKYTDAQGQSRFSLQADQKHIILRLEDSLPSVSEQDCKLLFEPLYRTEKSRTRDKGGAGLGLAICQNIVQAHKGSIHARPSQLGGLQICVLLPRSNKH
ncbi:ATP-binding protein [Glaciecola sp. 2405UD65-10]|uniref:ATP-binding protein n=1 Tax=Glaciecola sp. 2405UD65-10 TaxID=3397244 RepID=UPI003B58F303